jgi:ferredoxin-NADP reductase
MKVWVQVGGQFFLSDADLGRPLLFIAGGIGITPIASMLGHCADRASALLHIKQHTSAVACILNISDSCLAHHLG